MDWMRELDAGWRAFTALGWHVPEVHERQAHGGLPAYRIVHQ